MQHLASLRPHVWVLICVRFFRKIFNFVFFFFSILKLLIVTEGQREVEGTSGSSSVCAWEGKSLLSAFNFTEGCLCKVSHHCFTGSAKRCMNALKKINKNNNNELQNMLSAAFCVFGEPAVNLLHCFPCLKWRACRSKLSQVLLECSSHLEVAVRWL